MQWETCISQRKEKRPFLRWTSSSEPVREITVISRLRLSSGSKLPSPLMGNFSWRRAFLQIKKKKNFPSLRLLNRVRNGSPSKLILISLFWFNIRKLHFSECHFINYLLPKFSFSSAARQFHTSHVVPRRIRPRLSVLSRPGAVAGRLGGASEVIEFPRGRGEGGGNFRTKSPPSAPGSGNGNDNNWMWRLK